MDLGENFHATSSPRRTIVPARADATTGKNVYLGCPVYCQAEAAELSGLHYDSALSNLSSSSDSGDDDGDLTFSSDLGLHVLKTSLDCHEMYIHHGN